MTIVEEFMICPRCMSREVEVYKHKMIVGRCKSCNEIWFDRREMVELDRVKNKYSEKYKYVRKSKYESCSV